MRLAAEIAGDWAPILTDVTLKTGSKGVFDVSLDGRIVFSKGQLNRHPRPGEMRTLLRPLLGEPIEWR